MAVDDRGRASDAQVVGFASSSVRRTGNTNPITHLRFPKPLLKSRNRSEAAAVRAPRFKKNEAANRAAPLEDGGVLGVPRSPEAQQP